MDQHNRESVLKSKLFEDVVPRYLESGNKGKENLCDPSSGSVQKHSSYGKVPGYMKRMQQTKEDEARKNEEKARMAMIPSGCREMTEDERLDTIEEAKRKRGETLDELKRLPLRIETLGQRRRKIELEHTLTEVERTLDKLSHKTVLIKL
jgi:hypothetical protein